jgi:hypothetical protein
MSITAGLTATKATLELTKIITDLVKRPDIDVAGVHAKLHEMLIHAVSAQAALGEVQLELAELRKKLADQETIRSIEQSLDFAEETYWKRKSDQTLDGPYCPLCWDDAKKLIRLKFENEGQFSGKEGVRRRYNCIFHKTRFYLPARIFGPSRTIR